MSLDNVMAAWSIACNNRDCAMPPMMRPTLWLTQRQLKAESPQTRLRAVQKMQSLADPDLLELAVEAPPITVQAMPAPADSAEIRREMPPPELGSGAGT